MNESRTPAQRALVLLLSVGPLGYLPASGTVTVALIGIPLFLWMSTWPAAAYVVVMLAFTAASITSPTGRVSRGGERA